VDEGRESEGDTELEGGMLLTFDLEEHVKPLSVPASRPLNLRPQFSEPLPSQIDPELDQSGTNYSSLGSQDMSLRFVAKTQIKEGRSRNRRKQYM
jgi:hypothetical protein